MPPVRCSGAEATSTPHRPHGAAATETDPPPPVTSTSRSSDDSSHLTLMRTIRDAIAAERPIALLGLISSMLEIATSAGEMLGERHPDADLAGSVVPSWHERYSLPHDRRSEPSAAVDIARRAFRSLPSLVGCGHPDRTGGTMSAVTTLPRHQPAVARLPSAPGRREPGRAHRAAGTIRRGPR